MNTAAPSLFIADLHLAAERPATLELFLRFLSGPAREARALYILGDLFEAWLGDDVILPEYAPVLDAMAETVAAGTELFVQHGNRDFLLGAGFERRTGCQLLAETALVDTAAGPVAVEHGDRLCTDDQPYQAMRQQLRDPEWIAGFLAKSPEERVAFARELRERSQRETGGKAEAIMDVNAGAVEAAFRRAGVHTLIHGHTHRPAIHDLTCDDSPCRRIVVGDWHDTARYAVCDIDGCRLETFGP